MQGKFVKVSYNEFMARFLPPKGTRTRPRKYTKAFNKALQVSNVNHLEKDMYEPFVECVKKANLCPGYKFVLAQNKPDKDDITKQKVDACVFAEEEAPGDDRPHWAKQRMWVEWKRENEVDDPLDDKSPNFEATSLRRQENRGQIISYAAKVFESQHRMFLFTIMILRDHARIFRWDRSGAVVTEKFDYRKYPRYLGEFLRRFSLLSPEQQGIDPTAFIVEKGTDEYDLMTYMAKKQLAMSDYIRQYFKTSLDGECTRWKLSVEEDMQETSDSCQKTTKRKRIRYFLVGDPHFKAPGMAGRGTRGYVAIDCESKEFVYLKDTWRVNHTGIQKEGDVVRHLNDKSVENVPTLICHGDVGEQRTISQDIWRVNNKYAVQNPLKSHRHYRLVTKEVGRPLSDFRDGRELVLFIYHCLTAHEQAVERANIMHRDISAGNILIIERPGNGGQKVLRFGMLNDWELSKPVPKTSSNQHEPHLGDNDQFRDKINRPVDSDYDEGRREQYTEFHDENHDGRYDGQNSELDDEEYSEESSEKDEENDGEGYGEGEDNEGSDTFGEPWEDGYSEGYSEGEDEESRSVQEFDGDHDRKHSEQNNTTRVKDGQRQPDRTGTWQFLSVRLLNEPWMAVETADELESLFYVLLFHGMRYLRHNCDDVGSFMYNFFDVGTFQKGRWTCGARKEMSMTSGKIKTAETILKFKGWSNQDHPLNHIIQTMLTWFKARYYIIDSEEAQVPSFDVRPGANPEDPLDPTYLSGMPPDEDKALDEDLPVTENAEAASRTAAVLDSHLKMRTLLSQWVKKNDWPSDDKTRDQLPPNYKPQQVAGSKRGSFAVEDVETSESKRNQPSASTLPSLPISRGRSSTAKASNKQSTSKGASRSVGSVTRRRRKSGAR